MAASDFGPGWSEGFPSLWDRLADDLPDIVDQIAGIRAELQRTLGPERAAALFDALAGAREPPADLPKDAAALVGRLCRLEERRRVIERRGQNFGGEQLREVIRRDIEQLFNTERHEAEFFIGSVTRRGQPTDDEDDVDDPIPPPGGSVTSRGRRIESFAAWPEVRTSVLNYGLRSFSGLTAADLRSQDLADEIRQSIMAFEPRVRRDTLRVRVDPAEKHALAVEIEAEIACHPSEDEEPLHLKASVDLESGRARAVKGR